MKKADLMKGVLDGEFPAMVVEYRSTITEAFTWRDAATGRMVPIKSVKHNCEAGVHTYSISEKVADTLDLATYKPPFKKGQKIVWIVEGMARGKAGLKYSGRLEALEE